MKKLIASLLVVFMVILTVGYNLQLKSSKPLDNQDLAEKEGGRRFRLGCAGAIAGAAALAATGPGVILSIIGGIGVACACDRELDRAFRTHFQEIC